MENNAGDFSSYHPIDKLQEFHHHQAFYKWIYGGVGSSKSYTIEHHAIFLAKEYPGNEIILGRKVEHILDSTLYRETRDLCDHYSILEREERTKKYLWLTNGSLLRGVPMNLPITEYGSMNVGAVICSETSEIKEHILKYMVSRIRKKYDLNGNLIKHEMAVESTWQGHNYLWKMWVRDNKDNPKFQHWKVRTADNAMNLPEGYEENMRMIHSEDWCKRFLDCEEGSYAGLVYDQFDYDRHIIDDFLFDFDTEKAPKCLMIDSSPHNTAITVSILDVAHNIIYFLESVKQHNLVTYQVAKLIDMLMGRYGVERNEVYIDPAQSSIEQTSGSSVRKELRKELGFMPKYANKNKKVGIEKVKSRLDVKVNLDTMQEMANIYFMRHTNKPLFDEISEYVWADATLEEFETMIPKEEPKKQNDDCMDDMRYSVMVLDAIAFREKRYNDRGYDPRLDMPYYKEKIRSLSRSGKLHPNTLEKFIIRKPDNSKTHRRPIGKKLKSPLDKFNKA